MPGQPASNGANLLRAALAGPYPELQEAARKLVRAALRRSTTRAEAAAELGIGIRTLERIRADYPDLAG